jgi:hypothetical protein
MKLTHWVAYLMYTCLYVVDVLLMSLNVLLDKINFCHIHDGLHVDRCPPTTPIQITALRRIRTSGYILHSGLRPFTLSPLLIHLWIRVNDILKKKQLRTKLKGTLIKWPYNTLFYYGVECIETNVQEVQDSRMSWYLLWT